MNIELKGFEGHGWKVCDTCPCDEGGLEHGCKFGYTRKDGKIHPATGETCEGENEFGVKDDWYWVTLRPQVCIDKHGQ